MSFSDRFINFSLIKLFVIFVLSKYIDVLELLKGDSYLQIFDEIYRHTNISKTTVYRILKTLVHRGYVAQTGNGTYRLVSRPRKMRFGFGSQSADMPFSVAVTEILKAAAASAGGDLLIFRGESASFVGLSGLHYHRMSLRLSVHG